MHDAGEPVDMSKYDVAVGHLIWLASNTRVDIQFVVSQVSRYMHSLGSKHWQSVKCIFWYLKGIAEFALFFPRGEDSDDAWKGMLRLVGYSDSDWASDYDTHHSTSGKCFFLGTHVYLG